MRDVPIAKASHQSSESPWSASHVPERQRILRPVDPHAKLRYTPSRIELVQGRANCAVKQTQPGVAVNP